MSSATNTYESPISLPAKRIGKCEIRHRTLTRSPVIGIRQAYLRGCEPIIVEFATPRIIHYLLSDDHGTWMTDLPEEINQITEMIEELNPRGNVLVGGLGLGITATMISSIPRVKKITVVERDPDIIALCGNTDLYQVIQADISEHLKTAERYDCYILDTWQGTGESTWWEEVMPLKRIIRNLYGRQPKVHCWAEDIMAGQIIPVLMGINRHWYYKSLPKSMNLVQSCQFISEVGLPNWEKKYGSLIPHSIT